MKPDKPTPQEAKKMLMGLPKGPQTPFYFMGLEVENARSFKDPQFLDLSDGNGRPAKWTVILGNNGIGKTTLLQILAAHQPTVLNPVQTQQGQSSVLCPRLYSEPWFLKAFRRKDATHFGCYATFARGAKLSNKGAPLGTFSVEVEFKQMTWQMTGVFPNEIKDFLCCGYGARRRLSELSLSESRNDDTCITLFDESKALLNAEEWLLQADYAALKTPSRGANDRRDQIIGILKRLLPEIDEIRIQSPEDLTKASTVEAKTPYGWVSLRNLSSGYRSLVAWVVDFASRVLEAYPESPNPLAEAAVVLIDQIDLFLHPKWQVDLMDYLSNVFPNTQFIATAHSPLIVQAAEDANIVLLRRDGDHVIIDNDPAQVRGWRIDQLLTSDLFGLNSARDKKTQHILDERRALLEKAALSKEERDRLEQLNAMVHGVPFVESPEDIRAMELLREAAKSYAGRPKGND